MNKIIIKTKFLGENIYQEIQIPWSWTKVADRIRIGKLEKETSEFINNHIREIVDNIFKVGLMELYKKNEQNKSNS